VSVLHHKRIVDEFRQHGGTLTVAQLAATVGRLWGKDINEMRKLGYLIVEDGAGLFHLDLEALPELDAGRVADAAEDRDAWEGDGSSPGTGTDPRGEGETPLPLDIEEPKPASPYDPSVEAV
jgi:hypothetical protein